MVRNSKITKVPTSLGTCGPGDEWLVDMKMTIPSPHRHTETETESHHKSLSHLSVHAVESSKKKSPCGF